MSNNHIVNPVFLYFSFKNIYIKLEISYVTISLLIQTYI